MGRGSSQAQVSQNGVRPALEQPDGWRFFTWAGADYQDNQEERIGPDHPYARLLISLERQVAQRLQEAGVKPLKDIDVCFFHDRDGTKDAVGGCGINSDNRIQLSLDMDPRILKENRDYFVQMFCHEYCHGLFMRAFFTAHSADGQPRYDETQEDIIINKFQHGEVIAEEALADVFALIVHKQVNFPVGERVLSYQELLETNEYDDAYSLKKVLMALAKDLSDRQDNFVYRTLRLRETEPELGLFQCLEQSIEADSEINPEGLNFEQLYESVRAQFEK